jgi:hypothetical protein
MAGESFMSTTPPNAEFSARQKASSPFRKRRSGEALRGKARRLRKNTQRRR